jgi:hypothetical protein
MGPLSQPTTPGHSAATISKLPVKPRFDCSTDSTGVAIRISTRCYAIDDRTPHAHPSNLLQRYRNLVQHYRCSKP